MQRAPEADVAGGTAMDYPSAPADPALYELTEIEGESPHQAGVVGEPEPLKRPS